MPAAAAFAMRAVREPVMCAAHTSTRNGSATPALALTAIAAVTSAMPPTCWPRSANSDPAASSPIDEQVVVAAADHVDDHHRVGDGDPQRHRHPPAEAAGELGQRPHQQQQARAEGSRMSSTPAMMLSPIAQATALASRMNSGP